MDFFVGALWGILCTSITAYALHRKDLDKNTMSNLEDLQLIKTDLLESVQLIDNTLEKNDLEEVEELDDE